MNRNPRYIACVLILLAQITLWLVQLYFLQQFDSEFRQYMPHMGDRTEQHSIVDYFETWAFVVPGFDQWILVPLGIWLAFWRGKGQDKMVPVLFCVGYGILCLLTWYCCLVVFGLEMSAWD